MAESHLNGVTQSEYVFFNGERVARRDGVNGAGGVFYYFSDHLKTASVITDATATIKAESDYYPWGGELQFVNADSNHYKFTGKERDTETGLDYFGARYYSNGLGRFITPDWAAKATAVPYAEFADPQSLNLYGYVRNIPTSRFDADGHSLGDFLQRIWNGIKHGGCTIAGGCPTQEEAKEAAANRLAENAANARLWFIQHGYKLQQIAALTNQQAVDAFDAILHGQQEFTSGGTHFKFVQQVVNLARLIPPGGIGRLTNAQVNDLAKWSGMEPVKDPPFNAHGQKVFRIGNRYFSPDVDSHIGGVWKEFNRAGERIGTLDVFLNMIGK